MIGLVDYDLQTSTSTSRLIPNLEIMKLANYYQTEQQTFCRLLSLTETDLTTYDKIFFFSELTARPEIPSAYKRLSNVIYGGASFTNGKYIPFTPEIIDFMPPKTAIYKNFLKQKYDDGIAAKVIQRMLDDSYYRMYAGTTALPLPVVKPKKTIFIYDEELLVYNWERILSQLSARKPSVIVPIHPVICRKLSDFFKIRNMPKFSKTADFLLELNIPLEEADYMIRKYKNLFLANINHSSSVCLSLGNSFTTNYQYYRDFIYKMNLLYKFWCANIPVKLKYCTPQIGAKDPLATLSSMVVKWSSGQSKFNYSLEEKIDFVRTGDKTLKEEKAHLLKFAPSAKNLFKQKYTSLTKGGVWHS